MDKQSSTPKEFCKRHRICRGTFHNQVKKGALEVTRIGRRVIVTADQEEEFLKRCQGQEA